MAKQPRKTPRKSRRKALGSSPLPAMEEISAVVEETQQPEMFPEPEIAEPEALRVEIDEETGTVEIPHDDGSVLIELDAAPEIDPEFEDSHGANLAEALGMMELNTIGEDLLEGIESDDASRQEWLEVRRKGIDLLAIKVESPRSGASAVEGMSVVRDPVMLESVLRFQANAQGEMLPAAGPVKVVDYGLEDNKKAGLAEKLQKDLNFYLVKTASEYYPDTRRMFWETGFSGLAYKKVYRDPLKRRPVSETVPSEHLIVSDAITDLRSAQRVTHEIRLKRSTMKRMQILGVYRNVDLSDPIPDPNSYDEKVAQNQGLELNHQRPEDQLYEVYECYCELDIPGFEHKDQKGEPTGLPLPYRVTIERGTRQILEIRRNWKEDDEDFQAKIPFVAYPYATGPGFHGVGLLHILGNLTQALTAMLRESIDAGMFANVPGGLISQSNARQTNTTFRVAPGEFKPVDTGDKRIQDAVMGMPYKEVGASHVALIGQLRELAQRLGGTANANVGEGRQDAPVGTTLALIEQATKVEGAVLKALHAAQTEEFGLLVDLFRDDPESLWRGNKRSALGKDVAAFREALEYCDVVPQADPNVPSRIQRMAVAEVLKKMADGAPDRYNQEAVDRRILTIIGVDNQDELFAQQQAQGPDRAQMAEFQLKEQTNQIKKAEVAVKAAKIQSDAVQKEKDRETKQNLAVLELASTVGVHPEANEIVDEQIMQLSPLMTNIHDTMNNPSMRPPPRRPVPVPGLGGVGMSPMQFAPPPPRRPMAMQGVI